jgi:hypothetical protein
MRCKAQTTAIAQLWRGFATPQRAQSEALRAARDLFSVALSANPQGAQLGADRAAPKSVIDGFDQQPRQRKLCGVVSLQLA